MTCKGCYSDKFATYRTTKYQPEVVVCYRVVKTARFFKQVNCEEKDRLAG